MIETKEQYEALQLKRLLPKHGPPIGTGDHKDVFETLEALREVARAAKHLAARGYGEPNKSWQKNTLDKLDALPDWLTEANRQ